MSNKTMMLLKNLVIMESFFCVIRLYLIENKRTRLLCNIISASISITITIVMIIDLITVKQNMVLRVFITILAIELFSLSFGSRFKKPVFGAIERLDQACGEDEEYSSKIKTKTTWILLMFLFTIGLDFVGLKMLSLNDSVSLFLCVAFAAHDAELVFFSMVVESINMRLDKLKSASPYGGSRVYRYVLTTTAHLSEQYTPRLLLLLDITLVVGIIYESILTLADTKTLLHLSVYIVWRECRSMYCLWMLCCAVSRTDRVCSDLALHLAGRLTQDPSISKKINPIQNKTIQRWYSVLIAERPRYISGSILTIGLGTPILILDLSINYMLIIVQMYLAYK